MAKIISYITCNDDLQIKTYASSEIKYIIHWGSYEDHEFDFPWEIITEAGDNFWVTDIKKQTFGAELNERGIDGIITNYHIEELDDSDPKFTSDHGAFLYLHPGGR